MDSSGQRSQTHIQVDIESLECIPWKALMFGFGSGFRWLVNFMLVKSIQIPGLPGYDCASSSRNEVPWMGISCISHVQLPWGRLPGNGHVFPEIKVLIYSCNRERCKQNLSSKVWSFAIWPSESEALTTTSSPIFFGNIYHWILRLSLSDATPKV